MIPSGIGRSSMSRVPELTRHVLEDPARIEERKPAPPPHEPMHLRASRIGLDRVRRPACRERRADDRPHAGADDAPRPHATPLERASDADMRPATGSAAAERERESIGELRRGHRSGCADVLGTLA